MASVETAVSELEYRTHELEKDQALLWASIKIFEAKLAAAENSVVFSDAPPTQDFFESCWLPL